MKATTKPKGRSYPEKVDGPSACAPEKPCGMLAKAMAETDEMPCAGRFGLLTAISIGGLHTLVYRTGRRDAPLYRIEYCPWCGKRPNAERVE